MAESMVVVAQKRETRGSSEARRLRRRGMIPAVVYGHQQATLSVAVPGEELERAIRHGTRVVTLQADGNSETALIRDVQWDHLGKEMLHVDFARVAADERVVVTVPLEIRGTPLGLAQGGVLDQTMHALEVECLAIALPDHIRVNVAELQVGSALHVRDLVLPEGVKAMTDPDAVVIHVALKQLEAEAAAPAAVAAEGTEPEIIGRKAEEAEAE